MLSPKRKLLIIILVFLVLFSVFIWFVVFPFLSKIQKTSQSLTLQKTTLALLEKQTKDWESFQENYSVFESDLGRIHKGFVDPEAPISFLEFLEEEARIANLEMKIIPLSSYGAGPEPWLSIAFQVALGGDFRNCLRFLERLEKSYWLLEISNFNIRRISGKEKGSEEMTLAPGQVFLTLRLKAFSGREPAKEKAKQ